MVARSTVMIGFNRAKPRGSAIWPCIGILMAKRPQGRRAEVVGVSRHLRNLPRWIIYSSNLETSRQANSINQEEFEAMGISGSYFYKPILYTMILSQVEQSPPKYFIRALPLQIFPEYKGWI